MLILLVSTAAVAATALLVSSQLADGSITQWLAGAYVLAFAEIVLVSLLLSVAPHLTRWTLFAAVCGVFVVALAAVRRPTLPPIRSAVRLVLNALRDPAIATVAIVVVGVIGYSIALGLFSPPNDGDAIEYHLARGAFWRQQHAIGYVHGAGDARLDAFPPNGEIAMAFTMITSGTGRFAPLVQLLAALAGAVAVYGISRRVGIEVRESVFAALLFVTLPIVALQSSTGLNDVIVASLVAAAAFFLLRRSISNLALGGTSVALLTGTKLTGLVALPLLALVAFVARRERRLITLSVVGVSSAVGAYWYVLNLVKTGHIFGAVAGERGQAGGLEVVSRTARLGTDAFELTGAIGLDRLFYVGAAVCLAAMALIVRRSSRERATWAALAAGATLAPLVLVSADHLLIRGISKFFFEIGRSDLTFASRSATKASPIFSWWGPLGVLLTLLAAGFVVRAARRREMPAVAVVLVAAPAIAVVLLGIAIPYWEWNGRYIAGSFALAVATWGAALAVRPVAWAAASLAAITVLLAFVHLHDRPSGIRLLESTSERSVWSLPSWSVEATDHAPLRALFRYVDLNVPPRSRLALEPNLYPGGVHVGGNLPPFPFFGAHLTRKILFAESPRRAAEEHADWAILRDDGFGRCVRGWEEAYRYDVWVVLRRAPASRCG
ncbi:MAG: glycosyltransferase 87 family protein [Gaiellaceae bacterium]